MGSRVVLVFLNFYALFLILDVVMGFGPNLDVFVGFLLNKRVHETLKHDSPDNLTTLKKIF